MILQGVRRLLVGVDLSEIAPGRATMLDAAGQAAVDRALWLAESAGAEVVFCSALDIPQREADDLLPDAGGDSEIRAAGDFLDGLIAAAGLQGVRASSRIVAGRAWRELIREALRTPTDLLIVGTRRHTRAHRMLFGSTVMKLLRKCPVPVWVVRPGEPPEIPLVLAVDDFTDVGAETLQTAVSAAQLLTARLLVLHPCNFPLENRSARSGADEEQILEYRRQWLGEAERELNERLSRTDARTLSQGVRTELTTDSPDVALEKAVAAHQVDLLVMGAPAPTGISDMLLGNAAERLPPSSVENFAHVAFIVLDSRLAVGIDA